ncbi:PREDICTED: chymotrypsin-like elastase family member 2A [Pygoscelis adeliae]|uniref:chymotrypsin-like elastase family member 2A n=1 Tax=Pygoscelis adeliae TaxID=9238 RepID=UPI0004F4E836|nr:PREDICTED: chymotrypsin-like elastase family member 2A [Pygoscelis adeliae]
MNHSWDVTLFSERIAGWPANCGRGYFRPNAAGRITSGTEAKPHSWPWQVSLQLCTHSLRHNFSVTRISMSWKRLLMNETFVQVCGGTLIHKHWVLTAAHCFQKGEMEVASDWRILLGKHDLSHSESRQSAYRVKQIRPHEWLRENRSNRLDYDTALVKPTEDVNSKPLCPLCPPAQGRLPSLPGTVLPGNSRGGTTGIRALLVFKGQTGSALFSLKSKHTEKDYTAQPLPPARLDEEAKHLKCRFPGLRKGSRVCSGFKDIGGYPHLFWLEPCGN